MLAAEPDDIAGAIIIGVMRFGFLGAADLAGLGRDQPHALGGPDIQVGQIAPGIIPAPFLLACQDVVQCASPTNPVMP